MDKMELLAWLLALTPVLVIVMHFIPRPDIMRIIKRIDRMCKRSG